MLLADRFLTGVYILSSGSLRSLHASFDRYMLFALQSRTCRTAAVGLLQHRKQQSFAFQSLVCSSTEHLCSSMLLKAAEHQPLVFSGAAHELLDCSRQPAQAQRSSALLAAAQLLLSFCHWSPPEHAQHQTPAVQSKQLSFFAAAAIGLLQSSPALSGQLYRPSCQLLLFPTSEQWPHA